MCTCITLVLACKQAHMQRSSQRPRTFCTVTGMPLPLDKNNGGSGDEIGSLVRVQGKSACLQATLVPSRTTRWHNRSKSQSYLSAPNEWNLELFSKRALSLKWRFCPTFLGFTTLLGRDATLGQIGAKKKEWESKITPKMGRVEERRWLSFHFLHDQYRKSCSSAFLCSKTTQKHLLRRLSPCGPCGPSIPVVVIAVVVLVVVVVVAIVALCDNWITLYLLSLENFIPKSEAINNEDLIKQLLLD